MYLESAGPEKVTIVAINCSCRPVTNPVVLESFKVSMQRYLPHFALRQFINAYLIIESEKERENLIIPDVSVVIAIRFRGIVSGSDHGENYILPSAVISGLRQGPRVVNYSAGSGNFLIVFNPGGPAAFLTEPLHELSGFSLPLNTLQVFEDAEQITERLSTANSNDERIRIVDEILISKVKKTVIDPLVLHAVQQIKSNAGHARVKELIETLNISRDAFEKRFRKTVGTSPKQFSNIVRMRSLISSARDHKTLTELAYYSGYFDQSHFIKDFKLFTGQTPSQFFKSSAFW
jgi:AraC-like DNA-binding protein